MPPHWSPCPSGKRTGTGLGPSGARGCRARRPGSAATDACAHHGPRCSSRGPASARPRGLWRDCLRGRTLLRCHPRIPAHTTRRAPGARRFRGWRGAAFGRAPQTNHLPRALRPGPATFACARRAASCAPLCASGISARQLPCGGAQPAGGRGVGGASWPWPCNKLWARPCLAKPGPQPRSGPPGTRRWSESSTWLTARGQPSHPCGRPRSLVTSADQTGSCRRKRAVDKKNNNSRGSAPVPFLSFAVVWRLQCVHG